MDFTGGNDGKRNDFSMFTRAGKAAEQSGETDKTQASPAAMTEKKSVIQAPPMPRTLAEMGLNTIFMRDVLLKTMFRTNLELVTQLARECALANPICQELVDIAKSQNLLETTGQVETGELVELRYQLTDSGRARAIDALEQSAFFGSMPVPLHVFKEQVKRQSVANMVITRQRLEDSMEGIVVDQKMLNNIGPAVNSGKPILFYGPPGNGKSTLANRIRDAIGDKIYIPKFLEYRGQVISMYDPVIHESATEIEQDPNSLRINRDTIFDPRYLYCKRPAVITGGELKLDMLDLSYNDVSKTYQAPLQFKSIGGLFIVDDLGRQAEPPQALINRWITPMEEGEDILAMNSGEKFAVPFDTLVIFSTNFHPTEIFDGAALRRINSKILVPGPDRNSMLKIYVGEAARRGLRFSEDAAMYLFTQKYPEVDNLFAAYHPRFLFGQIENICAYQDIQPEVTEHLIDKAWANLFIKYEDIAK